MRSAFAKDLLRSIARSKGRFFAIMIIVALGAGFYAGLRMTAPDMKIAADEYYDGTRLYDIRVMSTLGFTDAGIEELSGVEGVEAVMPARETDAMALIGVEQYAVRVHSLDVEAAAASEVTDDAQVCSDDPSYLNRLLLVEGTWPTRADECVIAADCVMAAPVAIGDAVELTEGTQELSEVLESTRFTVVGFVRSPYYVSSTNLGTTSLGSGSIDQYLYVPESAFCDDVPYTEAFITASGAREEFAGSSDYEQAVDEVLARIEGMAPDLATARLGEVRSEAQDALDEERAAYESERADAEQQLADAQAELDSAKAELDSAQAELESAAAQLAQARAELAGGQASYDAGAAQLAQQRASAEAALASAQAEIDAQAAQLVSAEDELAGAKTQLETVQAQLSALSPGDPGYEELFQTAAALEAAISQSQAQLDAGRQALDAARAELEAQRSAAAQQLASAQAALDAAAAQISSGSAEIASGQAEYDEGLASYEEGLASYEEGLASYEEQRAQADEGFAEAEAQLSDAQAEIDAIEEPEIYVMDRTKNIGAEGFSSDAGRVDQIARVFPLLFFLVAALVSLTTMTRKVEEERVLIGTYKALGYRRAKIASKYLLYAFAASAVGAVVGIAVLSQVLPTVVFNAYAIVYAMPVRPTPIDPALAALAAGVGIGVTLLATAGAAGATLREQPAALMLPRAPKAGKRILLERLPFVWRRLSFTWKVTFRNIFRYKKRLLMTLAGIAGCTALLLTGFGLSNAINDIIDKQFYEIYRYNMIVGLDDDPSEEDAAAVEELLGDASRVERFARAATQSMTVRAANAPTDESDQVAQVIVPEDASGFSDYVLMRERVGHGPIALSDDGAVISEKLATRLGLSVGDEMLLFTQNAVGDAEGDGASVRVAGIMENYVSQYVFMTPALAEEALDEELAFSTMYAQATDDAEAREELSAELRAVDAVKTVTYNDETIETYRTMLKSVDTIVVVLIVAAAALAFVVLYNLTNINITERKREIATLKVLGFTPREVSAYIFRETILLTILAAAIGLVLGIFMEDFVVTTAEVDQVMFGREIRATSFAIAFALTLAFSAIVALFMKRKLDAVDMVESLKSVE